VLRKRALLYAAPGLWTGLWTFAWAVVEPEALLKRHLVAFTLAFGFVCALLVGRIVTARVTHVAFESWYWVILPLPLLVAHSALRLRLVPLETLLYAYTAVAIFSYLHFALSIIHEMTAYLHIRALVIPFPNIATKDDVWAKIFWPHAVAQSAAMTDGHDATKAH